MTKPVKTFVCKITDEYGGLYPQAFVAVREFSETSQRTGYSEDGKQPYEIDFETDAIAYKLSYWYDQGKVQQYRSRPLMHEDDNGEFSSVFTVDLDNPQIVNIINSTQDPDQGILSAIEYDVKNLKFK